MLRTSSIVLLASQLACASLFASANDQLHVSASVPHAVVKVDGQERGTAPMTVSLPKRKVSSVEVSAPGYRTAQCSTTMVAGGGYIAADVALCALLFPFGCLSFIDAAGAWNELERHTCNVTFTAEPTASRAP